MEWLIYVGIALVAILLVLFLVCFCIYRKVFYNDKKGKPESWEPLKGKLYEPFEQKSRDLIKAALEIPFEQVDLKVSKRKTLCARYYFVKDDAPTAIVAHGYKSVGIKDFSGGIQELLKREINVLVIDHYGHGLSSGKAIAFGVNEKDDLMLWIDYINKRNNNPDIFLYGISMGGATVLMTSGLNLPKNIKGVIADCPYTSVKQEIKDTVINMGLKFAPVYPLIFMSALIFVRFNIKKGEVKDYMKNCNIPVLIIHGNTDDKVLVEHSRFLAKEFPNKIRYVEIDGAPHGMSYFVDNKRYINELDNFLSEIKIKCC